MADNGHAEWHDALAYAEAIIATVREPLVVLDGDLRVRTVNRSFYQTFRVGPEDTEGRLFYSLGTGQWDIPALRKLLGEILTNNTTFNDFEIEHDFPDLGRRVMVLNARKLYREGTHSELILLAIEDVTLLREAEEQFQRHAAELEQRTRELQEANASLEASVEALRQSEELFRTMVEGVKDYAIFRLDPPGRVVTWNTGAERIKGYRAEEIIGQHFSRFYRAADRERGLPQRGLRLAVREGRYEDEGWRVRKDGSLFMADVVITPLFDREGHLAGFTKVTRDITGRKELERHLQGHAAELEQRTRELQEANAALQSFGYSISHDLRAPVRNMQTLAQALEEDYADRLDDEGRGYCHRITTAARKMDHLINDLLAYSRLSRSGLTLDRVDLSGVLIEAQSSLATLIGESQAQVTVEGPLPPVFGHRTTLVQVVTNLLGNALKFVAPGEQPRVRVWAERRDGLVRLWVEDNGIGIAPAHQQRIFNVFERLHGEESYPGTGIGLAIVKKGVERTGGRVGVESQVGKGSRFWVDMPQRGGRT